MWQEASRGCLGQLRRPGLGPTLHQLVSTWRVALVGRKLLMSYKALTMQDTLTWSRGCCAPWCWVLGTGPGIAGHHHPACQPQPRRLLPMLSVRRRLLQLP